MTQGISQRIESLKDGSPKKGRIASRLDAFNERASYKIADAPYKRDETILVSSIPGGMIMMMPPMLALAAVIGHTENTSLMAAVLIFIPVATAIFGTGLGFKLNGILANSDKTYTENGEKMVSSGEDYAYIKAHKKLTRQANRVFKKDDVARGIALDYLNQVLKSYNVVKTPLAEYKAIERSKKTAMKPA